MHLLLPIASILGIELEDLIDRAKRGAVIWGAFAFFVVLGLIFALVGANAALAEQVGPVWAPMILSGSALLIAACIYIGLRITASIAEKKETRRRHSAEKTALLTTAAMTALPFVLKTPIMRKVGIPVGGALAAAFLLMKPGANSSKRRLQPPETDNAE